MKLLEATKRAAVEWNSMPPDQKTKYTDLSKEDHKRYEKQKLELAENGFFMLGDG